MIAQLVQSNGIQIVRAIILEVENAIETRLQARIRLHEFLHVLGIPRRNYYKLTTLILHPLQQRLNGFPTKIIATAIAQTICLIDKQYTTHRFIDQLRCLDGCLTHISAYKSLPVAFNQMTSLQNTQGFIYLSQNPRYSGFTRTWVSAKHTVQ